MVAYRKPVKRTFRKKRTYSKPKVSLATKKYVRKVMPKVEVKRQIDGYTETTVDALISPYQIYEFQVTQGDGAYQRQGKQIHLIGLYIKSYFKNNAVGTAFVRCIVVSTASDTDTLGPTMELFKDANVSGTPTTIAVSGTSAVNVLYEINDSKFKKHWDKTYKLASTNSTDGRDVAWNKKFIKFNSLIKFDANTAGLGNQSRRFLVIYVTSEPPLDSGGSTIEITGTNKWYYTDA